MNSTVDRLLIIMFCSVLALASATAIDWPEDSVVHEGSESPDGHYGILVPGEEPNEEEWDNYLANLKTHRILGKIEGGDYFEHRNHAALNVEWSPDSKWCVATYWGRYGFGSIYILQLKDSKFVQTEVGERVRQSLDAEMKKQSRDKEMSGDAGPYFRCGPGRKLRVRAVSQNNPKQFDNVKTYYALFQGTYDVDAKKWTVTDARSITADQSDALEAGYNKPDFANTTFDNEDDRAKSLDEEMNKIYQADKFILPPARFAKVKQEQTEWLKKRDADSSVKEKCELMEKRIRELQDLLW